MSTRHRLWPAIGLSLYAVWCAVIVGLYYVWPDSVSVFDGPVTAAPFWRAALAEAAWSLTGFVLMLLAARAIALVVPAQTIPFSGSAERQTFLLAFGFIALSLAAQAAAYAGLYTKVPVAATVTTLAAVALVRVRLRAVRVPRVARLARREWGYAVIATVAGSMAAVRALAPEVEYDALWYHLWLPQQWTTAGGPVDLVDEYVSLYPLGWDLLYGAAMTIGGAGAAKLLHFVCLPLLAVTTWLLTRELAPRANPALAAALTVTTPLVTWEATTAYVDLALAWYVTLAVLAFVRYHRTDDRRWLIAAALVLGGGLGTKHLALIVLAILGVFLMVREAVCRRSITAAVRSGLLFGAISLSLAAPWYVRAYVQSGNPVFPDLYSVFGASPAERWSAKTEDDLSGFKSRFGRERTFAQLVRLPWDVTLHGAQYGGAIGPLFLMLVPAAFAWHAPVRYRRAVIGGCALYVAVWASPISSFQFRFLLPIVPVLSVLGAAGAQHLGAAARRVSPVLPGVMSASVIILLTLNLPVFIEWHDKDRYHGGYWLTHVMRGLPIGVVVGAEPPDRYVSRHVPSYAAWRYINSHLPDDAYVLTFSGGDHLYGKRRRLWSDSARARPATSQAPPGNERAAREALSQLGITHVLFDGRLLDDEANALAVGSPEMRSCCLEELFTDGRFVVFALRPDEARLERTSGTRRAAPERELP